jgi:replication factor A1
VLGESVDRTAIERELKLFFSYGVSAPEAKRGVIKKLGSHQSNLIGGTGGDKNLSEVKEGDNNINLKIKIISVDTKTVTVDGEDKTIYYGIIADETSSLPFTAWNDFKLEKGTAFQFTGAYVKGYRGELQINLGNNTSAKVIDSKELEGLTADKLAELSKPIEVTVGQLKPGISNFSVKGRIIKVEAREVDVKGTKKTVYSGIIGDTTGKVQFSAWHDFKLKIGDGISISNCYVKSWRGIPQLSFDENSKVEFVEDNSIPAVDQIEKSEVRNLIDFEELGGGFDVSIEGVVLELRTGSGLIKRCPECRRVLQDNQCMVHGAKPEGLIDLRAKAIVDDGTGSFMAVLSGPLTESILGINSDEYRTKADEQGYSDEIITSLKDIMLTKGYRLRGNVTRDNFGFMMIATEIMPVEKDVALEAKELLEKMGVV